MEDILNKEPVKRVQKKLNEFSNELKAIVLNSSARTAQQAAESLNTEVGSIVKSLLFKTEDSFVLCLVSGDKRCSLNKLKKIKNQRDISMANADEVKKVTGFTIGGINYGKRSYFWSRCKIKNAQWSKYLSKCSKSYIRSKGS